MPAPRTLRSQLLRWVLVPLSLVLLADVAATWLASRVVIQGIYDGDLAEIARELVLHVREDGPRPAFDLTPQAERTLLLDEVDTLYYSVHDAAGNAIAGRSDLPYPGNAGAGVRFSDAIYAGSPIRIAVLSTTPRAGAEPVVVAVAETRLKRETLTRKLLLGVALPQVVLILLAGALVWVGVARGLSPLERLRASVQARSHVDLSALDDHGAPGEVQPLVAAMNDFMARLSGVLEFQQRFIADTAHQLRTPVAGLKAHIEVALRENTLAQTRAALAHLYTSAERLAHLVAQLLSLARNEPHSARTDHFTLLDFNKLALETAAEWVGEADKKKIDLGFEGAGREVWVRGDAARLKELINNLVDNAVRYTPHAGRVTVHVRAEARPRLVVSDDGPRIPPEERSRVFERFHRLLGTQAEGSGLGLAIVRDIASLHEANIDLVEDSDGVGNSFIVTFPGTLQARNPAESLQ